VTPLRKLLDLARSGRLYPSVILHGGDRTARIEAAWELARTLLCDQPEGDRPCGHCRQCSRIGSEENLFHPDVQALGRDLKTSTSVAAARELLAMVHLAPFEARGQVFILLEAEALSPEAGDTLLKVIEEPPVRAPRNFFLLTPSPQDLLPTLRSRSWSVYLGPAARLPEVEVERLASFAAEALRSWAASGAGIHLLELARQLVAASGAEWKDPRAGRPWSLAAAALSRAAAGLDQVGLRRATLALASDLLEAQPLRLRGIPAERIVEGLVSRRLAGAALV
jgi:hypothetical protein